MPRTRKVGAALWGGVGTARGDDYLQVKKAVWPKGNELIGLKEWIKTKDVQKPEEVSGCRAQEKGGEKRQSGSREG